MSSKELDDYNAYRGADAAHWNINIITKVGNQKKQTKIHKSKRNPAMQQTIMAGHSAAAQSHTTIPYYDWHVILTDSIEIKKLPDLTKSNLLNPNLT